MTPLGVYNLPYKGERGSVVLFGMVIGIFMGVGITKAYGNISKKINNVFKFGKKFEE